MTNKSCYFALRALAVLLCSVSAALAAPAKPRDWQAKVAPALLRQAALGQTEVLIYMPAADLSGAASLRTKEEKGRYVFERLTAAAAATQPPVVQRLKSLGVEHQSFWISNVIWAKGDLAAIQAVASLTQVAYITPVGAPGGLSLPPLPSRASTPSISRIAVTAVEGGISAVNADDVWALGYLGQGVVVGGADTGVRWTHTALKKQYRGWDGTAATHDYNWWDGIHNPNAGCPGSSPEPCDDDVLFGGHGSHTMGTMVGDDGGDNKIGMAPQARWIACRNMNNGVGLPATAYLECMQFFLAPTKRDGTAPDPTKAPDVINNSWGCVEPGCVPEPNPPVPGFLRATLQASRAAGIVYVVSAGNEGQDSNGDCSTLQFPLARYPESFTVGAIDHRTDLAADFTSRGPVLGDPDHPTGLRKPDITAPGVDIRSVDTTNDSSYGLGSGTSMAGPHVAGLVALVISANPALRGNVDRIEEIIELSAVKLTSDQGCGEDTATSVPNNVYGWGRIDALAAVTMALAEVSAPRIDSITPSTVCQGGPDFTLTVTGTGFTAGTVVEINGTPRTTTFVDSTRVTVLVRTADITAPGGVTVRAVNPDSSASNTVTLTVTPDTTAPAVTPPAATTILQPHCGPPHEGGSTGNTSASLAAFIAGGSASDDCSAPAIRMSPRSGGQDVSNDTVFHPGSHSVTFRFRDNAGNIGTATTTLRVVLYADLNTDTHINAVDSVIIANFLVGNMEPGTPPFTAPEEAADLNRDTMVNAVDYVILQNYQVDNIDCLPTN